MPFFYGHTLPLPPVPIDLKDRENKRMCLGPVAKFHLAKIPSCRTG